ncbi:hypothetical protein VULLAG_LOCUS9676 [Vulpes lagopus]
MQAWRGPEESSGVQWGPAGSSEVLQGPAGPSGVQWGPVGSSGVQLGPAGGYRGAWRGQARHRRWRTEGRVDTQGAYPLPPAGPPTSELARLLLRIRKTSRRLRVPQKSLFLQLKVDIWGQDGSVLAQEAGTWADGGKVTHP